MTTKLIDAWRANRATFGGGLKPWSSRSVLGYYALLFVMAALLAVASNQPSQEFLNGALTAISIIAGFTFNALLFLADRRFDVVKDPYALEQVNLQSKLNELSDDLFANTHYFNYCALLTITASLVGLLGPSMAGSRLLGYNLPSIALVVTELAGKWLFFALLAETLITFLRTLRRLRYLFEKVRQAR